MLLQKYGRPNEATPAKWHAEYKDFNAPLENGTAASSKPTKPTSTSAGANQEQGQVADIAKLPSEPQSSRVKEEDDSKKRKRHDGETEEERTERKRKKQEKKERRKSKSKKEESEEDSP